MAEWISSYSQYSDAQPSNSAHRMRMKTVFGVPLDTEGEIEKRNAELSELDAEIDNLENQLEGARDRERRSRGR